MSGKLCVIVIGRNEEKTLGAVFARFAEVHAKLEGDCQLVYVDSDSTDSSMALAEEFAHLNPQCDVRIIRLRGKLNAAIARNTGIRHADPQGKYVFFLDADIVFEPDFVRDALLVMERDPKAGSVSGVLMNSYDVPEGDCTKRPIARSSDDGLLLWHGGNFLTSKCVIEQVGLFDDHLARHEDIDYSFRIRNRGYRLRVLKQQMGTHYTRAYLSPGRVLENLRNGNYVYSGLLFRKYCMSRRCMDMAKSISGVLLRCSILLCALASLLFPPAGILALSGFVVILGRKSTARGETLRSRALSLVAGIQFMMGLCKVREHPIYDIQVIEPAAEGASRGRLLIRGSENNETRSSVPR